MFHVRDQHSGVETGLKVCFKTRALAKGCGYRHSINVAKQIHTDGDDVRELRLINQTLFGMYKDYEMLWCIKIAYNNTYCFG